MKSKGTILVVEDDLRSLKMMAEVLQAEGYEVRPANSGALALAAMAAQLPDLVLLDIRMPEMDGFEVCRRMKADGRSRDIPVLFLSAEADQQNRVEGFALGAVDYVVKPFHREELLARINTHLDLQRLRKNLEGLVAVRTAELQRTTERLRMATRAANIAIWDWDIVKNALAWDEAMYEHYGQSAAGFRGDYAAWEAAFHPEDRERVAAAIQAALRGERDFNEEFRIVRPDGSLRFINAASRVFRSAEGKSLRMVGVNLDITESREAKAELIQHRDHLEDLVRERTAELQQARKEAEDASKAKSVFLANMSHELRTPFNAILGFSQIMARDEEATPSQKEYLAIILKSGEHLLGLINSVLDLAKIEAGKVQAQIEGFDLADLITDLITMLKGRAEAKGLQLFLDQSSSFPRVIRSDPAKLRQIIINLVGNAIKFTEQGQVNIKLYVDPRFKSPGKLFLVFEIKDTGHGMNAEDLERIFKPFEQARQRDFTEGTGLGLAIARQYVILLGGDIEVRSEPGVGSTFRFTIECESINTEDLLGIYQDFSSISAVENAEKYKILVVEDQPENRLFLKQLLLPYGFQIREAGDGREGVSSTREWLPDVVLMDRRMPVMDGIEATRAIRALGLDPQPVIVAITAHAYAEEKSEMFDAGCTDFLGKPVREDDLLTMLAKYIPITISRG